MQTNQASISRPADTAITLDQTTFHIRRDYSPDRTAAAAFCNQIQLILRAEKARAAGSASVRQVG